MKNETKQKLIFIYNANSGIRNAIVDSAHKIFSPNTYECSLCAITHGAFTENTDWKNFRTTANVDMEFLHKDEFQKTYASKFGYKFTFPIVLIEGDALDVFISTAALNEMKDIDDLVRFISSKMKV